MNRRSAPDVQLALPGLAPLCPHCGARRTEVVPPDAEQDVVSGQQWHCRACLRSFWSLPSLASGRAQRR